MDRFSSIIPGARGLEPGGETYQAANARKLVFDPGELAPVRNFIPKDLALILDCHHAGHEVIRHDRIERNSVEMLCYDCQYGWVEITNELLRHIDDALLPALLRPR